SITSHAVACEGRGAAGTETAAGAAPGAGCGAGAGVWAKARPKAKVAAAARTVSGPVERNFMKRVTPAASGLRAGRKGWEKRELYGRAQSRTGCGVPKPRPAM